jgi:hypothetical protein
VDLAILAALRLDLNNQGVRLSDELVAAGFSLALASGSGSHELAEGLDLVLPGGWWTNVCIAPGYARTSPYVLLPAEAIDPLALVLRHRTRGDLPVRVPATARFRHVRTSSGFSCGDIGAVHGPWLVIAPFTPREGIGLDRPRRFLGAAPQRPMTKKQWTVDEVVTCAEAAWRHAGARLIHLEAGHLLKDDGGVAELRPYLVGLKRALPTLVSVTVLPPERPEAVLELYAAGCDAVSYHLLAWDEAAAAQVAPVRARFVSHYRIRNALRAAARYFPAGAVSTDLLIGLEPVERVSEAMRELIGEGIVPNLSMFRPLPGAEDDAPHGELVPSEPLLALMAERQRIITASPLWHSRVRGFPRTLAGFDRYTVGLWTRVFAGLRRRWRALDPEVEDA